MFIHEEWLQYYAYKNYTTAVKQSKNNENEATKFENAAFT